MVSIAGASVSKVKTEASESVANLKVDSALGGGASLAPPSVAEGLSEEAAVENERTMDLENDGDYGESITVVTKTHFPQGSNLPTVQWSIVGEGFDPAAEEPDDSRKFDFWMQQMFIFFVMKFFPAYHADTMLKELINNRAATAKSCNTDNCICRGNSVEPDVQADVNPSALDTSAALSAPRPVSSPQSAVEA